MTDHSAPTVEELLRFIKTVSYCSNDPYLARFAAALITRYGDPDMPSPRPAAIPASVIEHNDSYDFDKRAGADS